MPVFTKPSWWVCCQKAIFCLFNLTTEASPIWSSSRVWQLNMLEFVFGWARSFFLENLPKNMWWCRGCLIKKKGFLQFSSCGPWIVFSHSNSPPHRALGQYRHTFSSRQVFNILSCLEPLNYCPDGGNGDLQCFNSFLTVTFYVVMLKNVQFFTIYGKAT